MTPWIRGAVGGALVAACSGGPGDVPPPPPPPPVVVGTPRTFVNVTEQVGVRLTIPVRDPQDQVIGAVAVADFDGDGRPDLLFTHEDDRPPELFLAGPTGYVERGAAWGLGAIRRTSAVLAADLDGDGREDLAISFVDLPAVRLFRNAGERFERVSPDPDPALADTVPSILAEDLDRDGWLDLVVAGQSLRDPESLRRCAGRLLQGCPSRVHAYRQTAPWRFEAIRVDMPTRRTQAIRMVDWDEDGRAEVFVAADMGFLDGGNLLLRVQPGPGGRGVELRDATAGTGVDVEMLGMGVAPIDVDGDGLDEVLVTNAGHNVLHQRRMRPARDLARALGASAYGVTVEGEPAVYRAFDPGNPLEGSILRFVEQFLDVASPALPTTKWAALTFDHDDDGLDDVYIAASPVGFAPYLPEALEPSGALLRGTGTRLVDVTGAAGLDQRRGHMAAAVADLDGDGDLDLVLHHPAFHRREGGASVYRNDGPPTRGLTVQARGRGGMRDGIGATVEVRVGGRTRRKRIDGAGGTYGCGPHEAHFGLGAATSVEVVTVRFPSGAVVRRENVPPGRLVVTED